MIIKQHNITQEDQTSEDLIETVLQVLDAEVLYKRIHELANTPPESIDNKPLSCIASMLMVSIVKEQDEGTR